MAQKPRKMRRADDAQRSHRGRFVRIGRRDDELANVRVTRESCGDRQRSAHRREGSVEVKLANDHASGEVVVVKKLYRVQNAESNREVESRSFFLHIGRREIDGDVARRKPESAVVQRRANARIGLAHGGIGKTDEGESRFRRLSGVDFDGDAYRVDPEGRGRPNFCEHGVPAMRKSRTEATSARGKSHACEFPFRIASTKQVSGRELKSACIKCWRRTGTTSRKSSIGGRAIDSSSPAKRKE